MDKAVMSKSDVERCPLDLILYKYYRREGGMGLDHWFFAFVL
jgi:hypothetical protein